MRTTWTFCSAGQLIFGRYAVRQVGDAARTLRAKKAFVVTDGTLIEAGVWEPVRVSLSEAGLIWQVFAGGQAEPSLKLADECAAVAAKFDPDVVIGVGGGSNMDVAKMTAVLLAHGGKSADYIGDGKVPGPVRPVICVPTTAGTGSEVSAAAAFTDTDNRVKTGM